MAALLLLLAALDEPRSPLEAFKAALRETKDVDEKVRLVLAFGASTSPDAAAVAELGRLLPPAPGDLRFALPTASLAVLSRWRGSKAAAQALERALPAYAKVPWVQRKIVAGLAQVGHECSTAALDAILRGPDLELALFTVGILPNLPPDLSVDALLRTWEWMEGRRPKANDEAKAGFQKLDAEILKRVQELSGERYPSMTEMARWWSKQAGVWKARARLRERERQPGELPAELPPALLFEFGFNEKAGSAAANGGAAAAWIPSGAVARNRPSWCGEAPHGGGAGSLDWGREPGPYAVDVVGVAEHLRELGNFSVTGWICVRSLAEAKGGNRVLSWLDRDGVEIVQREDGSLQVGIGGKAADSEIRTAPGALRVIDEADLHSPAACWTFFAVVREGREVRLYLGSRDRDAAPTAYGEAKPGKGGRLSPVLSIGNAPPSSRAAGGAFRGLIDEIRIFGGALSTADVVRIQGRPR